VTVPESGTVANWSPDSEPLVRLHWRDLARWVVVHRMQAVDDAKLGNILADFFPHFASNTQRSILGFLT
jgi:hypothetical protein